MSPATSVPPYSHPACVASAVTSPISLPPVPPSPSAIGSSPTANAIGTTTGAIIRSPRRTQTAVSTHTGRNSTPYAVSEAPNSTAHSPPSRNITSPQNNPLPSPVSRGFGSRPAWGAADADADAVRRTAAGRRCAPGARSPRSARTSASLSAPRFAWGGRDDLGRSRRGPYRAGRVLYCSTAPT